MVTLFGKRLLAFITIPVVLVSGAAKFVDVSVTLRGKKYSVPNVSTVSEIQQSVEDLSGLAASKQGVLFGGQKLKPTDVLEDVGIEDGSVINIVPSTKKKSKKSTSNVSNASTGATTTNSAVVDNSGSGQSESSGSTNNIMNDLLKAAGIDTDKMQDMLKGLPGAGDGPPDMMKSMEMMQQMMSSPLFKDFMNNPERLEQARQMILQNPMMKSMMGSLPGFEEIINDREKWRETMVAAAQMYENMSPDMMKAMVDMGAGMDLNKSMPGMGSGFGLPDLNASPAFAGLDELSEGDD